MKKGGIRNFGASKNNEKDYRKGVIK